ncbi:kanadaptin isoform X4 [Ascaphus truei]|uniref:kanadaptin isoform X4 n=1 Tax=Ascaphus truei TaxID=8439 RepID=UPI003F5AB1C6
METAELGPDTGDGPFAAGGLPAAGRGDEEPASARERSGCDGQGGEYAPGGRRPEGPGDAGTRRSEGPGNAGTRRSEGPGDAGTRRSEGAGDAGARRPEGPGDAGARRSEGPGDAGARRSEGPGDAGARRPEGPGDSRGRSPDGTGYAGDRRPEGPGDAGGRRPEGPRDAGGWRPEGPRDAGGRRPEGPGDAGGRRPEGPGDSGGRSPDGTGDAGVRRPERTGDAGVRRSEGHEDAGGRSLDGAGNAGVRRSEGTRDAGGRVPDGTRDARGRRSEGPGNAEARGPDGTGDAGARGPDGTGDAGARGPDGTGDAGARGHDGTGDAGGRSPEGTWDAGFRRPEGPRAAGVRRPEGPGDAGSSINEGLHVTGVNGKKQWTARTSGTQGTYASQPGGERRFSPRISGDEEPHAPGTICSEEPASSRARGGQGPHAAGINVIEERLNPGFNVGENASRISRGEGTHDTWVRPPGDSTMEGPSDAGDGESFKKPASPALPTGNEATLEPRAKPPTTSSHPLPSFCGRAPSREATTDVSHGLQSDAYPSQPAIPYREPPWSGRPGALFSLEILKDGSIASTKSLDGLSWTLFGRLPGCHVSLEHPSVSRYHAVLQYRQVPGSDPDQEPGFYVYDLGSTHGTFINKQRIQSKTYCRFRVGHVLKFGGSTRIFVLQGPEDDQEAESELTVTQIKEARRQRESLQKKMLGDDSDEEDTLEEEEGTKAPTGSGEDGCSWGMGEDAVEEETDENPIAMEFQEDKEAFYLKNPKRALQGFFDREGEELEFEYEDRGRGSWLCRAKLPADDSSGNQLVAEAIHSGKKRDTMVQCALEACRMLDSRGLLRQEAVSRKKRAKKWEDEDFYDSDDDTFLDRTGLVEKKRINRMKKAGKIENKPETYDSLVTKLDIVEKELSEIAAKLQTSQKGEAQTSAQDSLDAFMTEIKSSSSLDGVTRSKLHLQSFELKKEQQRLKALIKIVQPTKLPELLSDQASQKAKKLTLPMFGAMKGGSKFKLKTGTVGKLPPKRIDLPASFFDMKEGSNEPEEEEEEEEREEEMQVENTRESNFVQNPEHRLAGDKEAEDRATPDDGSHPQSSHEADVQEKLSFVGLQTNPQVSDASCHKQELTESKSPETKKVPEKKKRMYGPSRPPRSVPSTQYPEDDPDYCVWTPPSGQTGDGKTHLNDKYGY